MFLGIVCIVWYCVFGIVCIGYCVLWYCVVMCVLGIGYCVYWVLGIWYWVLGGIGWYCVFSVTLFGSLQSPTVRSQVAMGVAGSVTMVVTFLLRQVKFNRFLVPNEHPERIYLYLVRQLDDQQAKIRHIFTKHSFLRLI